MPIRTFTLLASLVLLSPLGCGRESAASGTAGPAGWVRLRDPLASDKLVMPAPDASSFGLRHPYRFSQDWFSKRLPQWVSLLRASMGQPGLQYLEVGVYEGRSLLWMVDHVLTHKTSRATGIDIRLSEALLENVERSGAAERITLLQAPSQVQLRKLDPSSYDVIYIDGSHMSHDVLEDIVLSWPLLKTGGLMILDDYRYTGSSSVRGALTPAELRPRIAIDGFISAYRGSVIVVYKGYQMALRKAEEVCTRSLWQCTRFGDYAYDWRTGELYRGDEDFELSEDERNVLEGLIRSKRGDGVTLRVRRELLARPAFQSLDQRLGLRLKPLQAQPGA